MLPVFTRLPLREATATVADEAGQQARQVLAGLLHELPELLMACVVAVHSGQLLAFYTQSKTHNPNHIRLRYAKLLRSLLLAPANRALPGGPLTEISVVLDHELHHLRLLRANQWYAFVAVRTADANLALTRDVMRRCTQ